MARGDDRQQQGMFSYLSPEERVPPDHPLRPVRAMVNEILSELSPQFSKLYARRGRPSVAPEKLLRALLLQMFYSVRSESMLLEQLRYNLLFRWFVGLSPDDPVWDATTFTKNRDRLLEGDIAAQFLAAVLAQVDPLGGDGGARGDRRGAGAVGGPLRRRLRNSAIARLARAEPAGSRDVVSRRACCISGCSDRQPPGLAHRQALDG